MALRLYHDVIMFHVHNPDAGVSYATPITRSDGISMIADAMAYGTFKTGLTLPKHAHDIQRLLGLSVECLTEDQIDLGEAAMLPPDTALVVLAEATADLLCFEERRLVPTSP